MACLKSVTCSKCKFSTAASKKLHYHHSYDQQKSMAPANDIDLDTLGTPENCVADFCLIPVFFSSRGYKSLVQSDSVADRNSHSISVTRSCRRSALDAKEQIDVFDAFCRNDCG